MAGLGIQRGGRCGSAWSRGGRRRGGAAPPPGAPEATRQPRRARTRQPGRRSVAAGWREAAGRAGPVGGAEVEADSHFEPKGGAGAARRGLDANRAAHHVDELLAEPGAWG
jgi:hypothetical protein